MTKEQRKSLSEAEIQLSLTSSERVGYQAFLNGKDESANPYRRTNKVGEPNPISMRLDDSWRKGYWIASLYHGKRKDDQ